jgi:glycine cleavage system aminomethyltransferase T
MLLCSPRATEAVMGWAAAQGDGLKVAATDVSSRCVMLSLIGPEAEVVLRELAEVRQGAGDRQGGRTDRQLDTNDASDFP